MSIQQGWHLNVAKLRDNLTPREIEWRKSWPESGYMHYCNIFIGDDRVEEGMIAKAREIAARFPESEGFKCSLTAWWNSGTTYEIAPAEGSVTR